MCTTAIRENICESCKDTYEPINDRQRYCKNCKENGIKCICENCEKEFTTQKETKERFCSDECRSEGLKLSNRKCYYCGEKFEAKSTNQKYCSKRCSEEHRGVFNYNYNLECKTCNENFEHIDRRTLYCSSECEEKNTSRRCMNCSKIFEKNKKNEVWCSEKCRSDLKENNCKKCDKTFYARVQKAHCSDKCKQAECKLCNKTYIQKNGEKFCGEECTKKYYTHTCKACEKDFFKKAEKAVFCSKECKENISKVQKKHKVCKNCKKIILVLDESVSFCNAECSQEYRRNKQLKAKNKKTDEEILEIVTKRVDILLERKKRFLEEGMFATIDYWKVDGFTYDLKQKILERDEFRCYVCEHDKELEVHHILCRKLGGTHEEDNLVSLCTKCHRHVETGNREHAIKKCFKNAKIHMGTPTIKLKERINKMDQILFLEHSMSKIYEKLAELSNEELIEIKMEFDDIMDEIEELKRI